MDGLQNIVKIRLPDKDTTLAVNGATDVATTIINGDW